MKIVLVGAGIANLCAANVLLDHGVETLLIDAGLFPTHRICGEFFSAECHFLLEKWNLLPPVEIKKAAFFLKEKKLEFNLPFPARSISRYHLDNALLNRIKQKGGGVRLQTKVEKVESHEKGCTVYIANEIIRANSVIVGVGRNATSLQFPYIGFKMHVQNYPLDHLQMHFFNGGYVGLSPIEEGKTNVACLVKKEHFKNSPEETLSFLPLAKSKPCFEKWLLCKVPSFGIKKPSFQDHIYCIGDAKATIPPASGGGLTNGMLSGYMAAHYALRGDAKGFYHAWNSIFSSAYRYGLLLHHLCLTPYLNQSLFQISHFFPHLFPLFYKHTRVNGVEKLK